MNKMNRVKSTIKVSNPEITQGKIVIEHGHNAMIILDEWEADDLVTQLDAIIYDDKETHKYLSERNTYLETRNEQLEHENIRMMEELELCR